ncbi:glycosyltransferase [Kitasatospora sp. GP82]|uniref:glycosyltransferase n=1 Tax=Kitasatospora sp. GP82 TaxID=3035089 RepID=UPI0024742A02|nr:glycosyltransferase [Kitasatospora sp. GP82]MDH6124368.1 glycosyltransferase involved in cell wall biosynthesis [Kitasatospora sp. GP82]
MSRDIFIVSNSVDELGGVSSWSHRMAELLSARGHGVQLIGIAPAVLHKDFGDDLPYGMTTLYSERPASAWTPRYPWQRLDGKARRQEAQRAAGVRSAAARMNQLFRAARPGAVVIVTQVWAMEWVAQADLSGLQVIGMTHESYETCKATSRYGRVKRYYADVDRLVALTDEDADAWIRDGMNSTCGIPNPLPFSLPETVPSATKTVISIGRLSQEKGYDLLLEAWATVVDRRPGWQLKVYGLGEEEAALRAQCTALGLDGSVEFAGRTDDVPGALAGASIFAMSSRGEGFPISLMEAMACGVPCVAFDCAPGVREIIRDGEDGLLAPTGNTTALAKQLGRLMDDQELRDTMAKKAREAIVRYSPEQVTARWEELFALLDS